MDAPQTIEDELLAYKGLEPYTKAPFGNISLPSLPDDLKRIRWCESNNRHFLPDGSVIRGIENPNDIGKYMINKKYHGEEALARGINIFNEQGNELFAIVLYNQKGAKPWYLSYDPITKLCTNGVVIPEIY